MLLQTTFSLWQALTHFIELRKLEAHCFFQSVCTRTLNSSASTHGLKALGGLHGVQRADEAADEDAVDVRQRLVALLASHRRRFLQRRAPIWTTFYGTDYTREGHHTKPFTKESITGWRTTCNGVS